MKSNSKLEAILWTLLCPGLGQISISKIKKGLLLNITMIILFVLFINTHLFRHFNIMVTFLIFGLLVFTYSVVDIVKTNKIMKSKWYVTIGYFIIYIVIVNILSSFSSYRAYKIPTVSMNPTMMFKDFFIADAAYYKSTQIKKGDLIIFIEPQNHEMYIKRVIGTGNDTVTIIGGNVYINSSHINEPYLLKDNKSFPDTFNLPQTVIPSNQLFVLGDNRNNSIDSRHFGSIDINSIIGRPLYVYFSLADLKRIGIRYN